LLFGQLAFNFWRNIPSSWTVNASKTCKITPSKLVRCLKWRNGSLLSVLKHQHFIYAISYFLFTHIQMLQFVLLHRCIYSFMWCFKVALTICKHNLNIKTQISSWMQMFKSLTTLLQTQFKCYNLNKFLNLQKLLKDFNI